MCIVSLFTREEKENIAKEFTYAKRINRNNQDAPVAVSTIESDWFTEQNIDSTQSELTRNITSKSVILAPFNSTITESEESPEKPPDSVFFEKRIIKLGPKVREIDRQYEKNNNCEVDNGVYNKFAYEPSERSKREELDPLASNEGSMSGPSPPGEHVRSSAPLRGDVRKKENIGNDAVQTYLLNSLAPKPLVIGID